MKSIYMKIVPQGYWTESRMKSIYIYEDSASRILDRIKDEVHIYEDIFALCFGTK